MMDVVSVEKAPHECEEGFTTQQMLCVQKAPCECEEGFTKDAPSVVKAPCEYERGFMLTRVD